MAGIARRKTFLRAVLALTAIVLLLSLAASVFAEGGYRTLKKGSKGEDVLKLKERMYELGYFTSAKLTDQYNDTMADRVKELQKKNGLTANGIASPELQELIFSDDCIPKDGEAKQPETAGGEKGAAAAYKMPSPAGKGAPEPDADGFLDADEPYVYADRWRLPSNTGNRRGSARW